MRFVNIWLAAMPMGLIFALAACAGTVTPPAGEDYATKVAATIYARQAEEAALPTAKPTRTTTPNPATIAATPMPLQGGLPPSPGTPISIGNIERIALLGILEPEWPMVFMGPTAIKYSPDGSLLAVATPNRVYLLDGKEFQLLLTQGMDRGITSLAFSPDGQMLAIGSFDEIVLFDLLAEQPFAILEFPDRTWMPVTALAIFQDGKNLLSAVGDQVQSWDVESGKITRTLELPPQLTQQPQGMPPRQGEVEIRQISFSPSEELVFVQACDKGTSYYPGNCSLWVSAADDSEFQRVVWGDAISFSRDGRWMALSGLLWSCIKDLAGVTASDLYGLVSGKEENTSRFLNWRGNNNAISWNGQQVAIVYGHQVHLLDIASGELVATVDLTADPEGALFSPDGNKLILWRSCYYYGCSGVPNYIRIVDIKTQQIEDLVNVTGPFSLVNYSPDGKWLAARDVFNQTQVWDIKTGKLLYNLSDDCEDCTLPFDLDISSFFRINENYYQAQNIAFSPDSKTLAASYSDDYDFQWAADGYVELNQVNTGTALTRLETDDCRPTGSIQFSPDGTLLATVYSNKVCIWAMPGGELLRTLTTTDDSGVDYASALAFSEDGSKLAAGSSSGEVFLWETSTWDLLWSYPVHEGYESLVYDLVFINEDQTLVSAGQDGSVRVRHASDGAAVKVFISSNIPLGLAFSPDEKLFIYGDVISSPSSQIFNFTTGEILSIVGNSNVISAAFSPDGLWLVTTHDDGKLYFWGIP